MPSSGAFLLRDLPLGRPCRIVCRNCDRAGQYHVGTLAARFGWDALLPDVLAKLSADCPRRGDYSNPCGAVYAEPLGHA